MKRFVTTIAILLGCVTCLLPTVVASDASHIGKSIEEFTLDNCYGKSVSLSDFEDSELVAVIFLGTECPLAKLYGPRLNAIQEKFGSRLQIVGVNSNKQDSMTEIVNYVHLHDIKFPMLKDPGNRVADAFAAARTPEVFLLDQQRVVRYHGRIDDQYGVGYSRERGATPDLANAAEALLAGRKLESPETEAVGCHIGRVKEITPSGDITYNKHIAAILNSRCVQCHREGEIAPFTLTSYDDVLGWEDTILEVIEDNRMPPWSANPAHGKFANDARVSGKERELIETWIDNGMPEGDPKDLPPTPKLVVGWQIGEPDQIIPMQQHPVTKAPVAFKVAAEGILDYQHFVVDPGWDEDKYIVAAEARPDCRAVVHHILVYVLPEKNDKDSRKRRQILIGYAPGALPLTLTNGIALKVPAGRKLLFEMHYTPNGTAQEDSSYIGVKFTDKASVERLLGGAAAAETDFEIPPGKADQEVVAHYRASHREELLSMTPHMHLRGKSFKYELLDKRGSKIETLLDVPNYDFNWQLKYILETPRLLEPGMIVRCTAMYDNSPENLTNPDPMKTVRWGDQSFDEMMIGFMETVPVKQR